MRACARRPGPEGVGGMRGWVGLPLCLLLLPAAALAGDGCLGRCSLGPLQRQPTKPHIVLPLPPKVTQWSHNLPSCCYVFLECAECSLVTTACNLQACTHFLASSNYLHI